MKRSWLWLALSLAASLSSGAGLSLAGAAAAQPPSEGGWVRRPGVWYPAPPAPPSAVRLEEERLVFSENSAVRRRRVLLEGARGAFHLSVHLDPAVGEHQTLTWMSVMLTPRAETLSWVTTSDHTFSMYIRSNGALHVLSQGVTAEVEWQEEPPPAADGYQVDLELRRAPEGVLLYGSVNGRRFGARLAARALPEELYLSLGAHFHHRGQHSVATDVRVSTP